MTIDITPEAVERMARWHLAGNENFSALTCATLRALSAALTTSKTETAAAYEAAAWVCVTAAHERRDQLEAGRNVPAHAVNVPQQMRWSAGAIQAEKLRDAIRSLTPADSKAALDRMIAEARAESLSGPWDDKPDALTDAVEAAHPHHTKDFATYIEALELVSNRHSKGALVGLVNYLLAKNKATPKGKDHE